MEIGHSFNSSWNKHIHCQQFEIRVHIFAGLTDISTNLTEAIDKTTVEMNTHTPKKHIHRSQTNSEWYGFAHGISFNAIKSRLSLIMKYSHTKQNTMDNIPVHLAYG